MTTEVEKITDLGSTIEDLASCEPRQFGSDSDAKDAAAWVLWAKKVEESADELLDPGIKEAFASHKKLTGQKKSLLEKLSAAKDRVRFNLANWIAGGHAVKGCYIKSKWRVVVQDEKKLPDEYFIVSVDQKKLDEWATKTEGKVAIPGCVVEQVNVLYSKETE